MNQGEEGTDVVLADSGNQSGLQDREDRGPRSPQPTRVDLPVRKGEQRQRSSGPAFARLRLQAYPGREFPRVVGRCTQDALLGRTTRNCALKSIVPSGKEGILRLWLVDGDNRGRKERVNVQGRMIGEYADFGRKGVEVAVPVSAADAKSGKIDVSVVNLGPATAVVSTVAFTPQAIQPRR